MSAALLPRRDGATHVVVGRGDGRGAARPTVAAAPTLVARLHESPEMEITPMKYMLLIYGDEQALDADGAGEVLRRVRAAGATTSMPAGSIWAPPHST